MKSAKKIKRKKIKVGKQKGTKNPFLTRVEIQTDLREAGINVSKDTISRVLNRAGFVSRSPRKVPLLKLKHVRSRLNYVKTYGEQPQGNLVR